MDESFKKMAQSWTLKLDEILASNTPEEAVIRMMKGAINLDDSKAIESLLIVTFTRLTLYHTLLRGIPIEPDACLFH